jgi:hypothetical protein
MVIACVSLRLETDIALLFLSFLLSFFLSFKALLLGRSRPAMTPTTITQRSPRTTSGNVGSHSPYNERRRLMDPSPLPSPATSFNNFMSIDDLVPSQVAPIEISRKISPIQPSPIQMAQEISPTEITQKVSPIEISLNVP